LSKSRAASYRGSGRSLSLLSTMTSGFRPWSRCERLPALDEIAVELVLLGLVRPCSGSRAFLTSSLSATVFVLWHTQDILSQ
jgi:hypothetical protein